MISRIHATSLLEEVSEQVDGAEVYQLCSLGLPISFRAGALESVKAVETAGRALRVIYEGRLGFSTTTDLADSTTLVQNALQAAQFGDPVPFEFPERQPSTAVQCFDPKIEVLDERELIALGEEVVEKIKAYDPDLQVDVSVRKAIDTITLLNTSGLEIMDRRTFLSVSVDVTRTRENDILILHDMASSHRREDVDALSLAERLVERLSWSETTAAVPSKAMPIVFRSMATLCLILPLTVGLNGRHVYLGASPLGEKLGQQVFDPRFTYVDDGRLDFAALSAPYDDEGTPAAKKLLIEEGVVCQFLYDLKTAAQAEAAPTGNGFKADGWYRRGFHLPPGVMPATGVIPPGEQSLEELLGGLDEALLVEDVLGLGQGNILAGEFSNNVSLGFLVRNGEVIGRVKNTMIAGNVYELLKDRLIGLGDRAEWHKGILNSPPIAIDGVGVAGEG